MITSRVSNVKDEGALVAVLDSLEADYSVRVRYLQPCFPQRFDVCVEGRDERKFQTDLETRAAKAGWQVKEAPLALFHDPAI